MFCGDVSPSVAVGIVKSEWVNS